MKRVLAVFLTIAILFSVTMPVYASHEGMSEKELIEDVASNLDVVAKRAASVEILAKNASTLQNVQSNFANFVRGAQLASSVFGIINGSVNFLKLIGVIKDSNTQDIHNIKVQLQSMDERLAEMDNKLTDITNRMAQMQASIEFNARSEKATAMAERWNDFTYRYEEEGLDKLMDEYDAMLLNGMMDWCKNTTSTSRMINDIDNTSITVLYKKTDKGYQLTYSTKNGVPSSFTLEDRYITISASRLPTNVEWNVNNYTEAIRLQILNGLSAAIQGVDHSGVEVYNYPELYENLKTQSLSYMLNQIATDAVNTLVYRTAAAQLNKDATFTKNVIRNYSNYCTHLTSSEDGLDAILKTFYLTHCFEGDIADELTEFLNIMAVKNATYGLFVANVLGASQTATDSEKTTAFTSFDTTLSYINSACNKALTGYRFYNYITNSMLYLSSITFETSGSITLTHQANGNSKFEGYSASKITPVINQGFFEGSTMMNDVQLLLLQLTAQSNGDTLNFAYLKEKAESAYVYDYGKLITSYGEEQAYSVDGTIPLSVINVSGDYFTSSSIKNLPEDADAGDLVYRKKVVGGVYDMSTQTYSSSQTLLAMAIFGEDHWYWRISEAALLAGSSNSATFRMNSGMRESLGDFKYKYPMTASVQYNMLMNVPVQPSVSAGDGNGYDPLESYLTMSNSLPNNEATGESQMLITLGSLFFASVFFVVVDSDTWGKMKRKEDSEK